MNIEELKMVLEAINQFTAQATTAGIWWAAMHYTLPALTKIIGFIVAGTVAVKLARIIAGTSQWVDAGKRVSKAFGGSGYSIMYYNDEKAINTAITLATQHRAKQ